MKETNKSLALIILKILFFFAIYNGLQISIQYLLVFNLELDSFDLKTQIQIIYSITYLVIFLLLFLYFLLYQKKNVVAPNFRYIRFYEITIVLILSWLLFIIIDPIFRFNEIIGIHFPEDHKLMPDFLWMELFLNLVNTSFFMVIIEELVYRKIFLSLFKERTKKEIYIGVFFSSILFGLGHFFGSINLMFAAFILGIFTSIVYLQYGLIYSIILHASYNSITLLFEYRIDFYRKFINDLNFGILYWLFIGISFLILLLMSFRITKKMN